MAAIVHTAEAIRSLLQRGLTPVTDNREALLELGFERAYPQVRTGWESLIWERSIELARRAADGRKLLARERALLELRPAL